ncbi:acyltransferase family protein [Streptomyces sp. NPDC000229]|uniref:acyltransferase family protein n=1 Tax=Streptomyces sp. NPDC000229 TaxID=3154247 RepID=UPI004037D2D4
MTNSYTGGPYDDAEGRPYDRPHDDGSYASWPYERTGAAGATQPYPAADPEPDHLGWRAPERDTRSYAPFGAEPAPYAQPYGAAHPSVSATLTEPESGTGTATATVTASPDANADAGSGPEPDAARKATGGRDRYFDLLRALALFRVVLYHLTGWMWLPLVFPSMGVMFALAGNLMARSLKRPPAQVIKSRVRRLLPPLWAAGGIGVTAMLVQGWGPAEGEDTLTWWLELLFWILPLSDPPHAAELAGIPGILPGTWAEPFAGPLWYIRAYLWFVLLSPLFLAALRKQPWLTIAAPLVLMAALNSGYLQAAEEIAPILYSIGEFGACWILGMAHQEGVLKRLPGYVVPSVAPFIMGFGLWWAADHGLSTENPLGNMPFPSTFWSLGFVLLLLHFSPSWSEWPRLLERFDGAITLLNSRAVTVYLWHNVCIAIAVTMWHRLWSLEVMWRDLPWLMNSHWPLLVFSWSLIAYCILLFGWLEDVAAKRRPRLWPSGAATRSKKGLDT